MTEHLVIDTEFVLDPSLPAPPCADPERMPAPAYHKLVCIGAMLMREHKPVRLGIVGESGAERESLVALSEMLSRRRSCLVTWNGRGADLPVIAARALLHGVPLPHIYQARDVRYRYSTDGHFDLMDFLSDYGATKPISLHLAARLCGMPGKLDGMTGAGVADMVAAGDIEGVRNYGLCDVAQTGGVLLRVELLRGSISREAYVDAMGALVAFIDADVRLKPLADAMNRKRLMLEEDTNA
jgi:predicted PolB exonuclease-like 3'-5' exonuclease